MNEEICPGIERDIQSIIALNDLDVCFVCKSQTSWACISFAGNRALAIWSDPPPGLPPGIDRVSVTKEEAFQLAAMNDCNGVVWLDQNNRAEYGVRFIDPSVFDES